MSASAVAARRGGRDTTPDSRAFATRPYDLVKELVVALVVVGVLVAGLAAALSSPDRPALSLQSWSKAAPADVVATATAELAGTSTSAGYGPPYNSASEGAKLGPLPLQRWAGVRIPVDSAQDLVLAPLSTVTGDPTLRDALAAWSSAPEATRLGWATTYGEALAAAPDGDPAKVAAGSYGPVPLLAERFLRLAGTGGLEGLLVTQASFYGTDATKPLLLLADGAYIEDRARADHLGGDQWGMMNETGNYPGQPWMWLYTFWYQVPPFSTSGNADALVLALMALLTAVFVCVPFVPGLRSIPARLGIYRLIWREHVG